MTQHSGAVGSSYAAPRVTKALAMIEKRYPESRLEDRIAALAVAAKNSPTYRDNGNVFTAPLLDKRNMQAAYDYVEVQLQPDPQPNPDPDEGDTPVFNTPALLGPAYGGQNKELFFEFRIEDLVPSLGANLAPKNIAFNTTSLSQARDVLIKVRGIGNRFSLTINNAFPITISGFSSTESTNSVIVHRENFEDGENSIEL